MTTLLPDGRVLVTGGRTQLFGITFALSSSQVLDLRNLAEFDETDLDLPFAAHATAIALSGRVFYAGGVLDDSLGPPVTPVNFCDRYDEGRYVPAAVKPLLNGVTGTAPPGGTISLTGGRFTGSNRGATGGGYNDSATNHPLVELTRIEGEIQAYARTTAFTSTTATAVLPTNLQKGHWLVRVVVNGGISDARLLLVQ